jgi:hypothetical protein
VDASNGAVSQSAPTSGCGAVGQPASLGSRSTAGSNPASQTRTLVAQVPSRRSTSDTKCSGAAEGSAKQQGPRYGHRAIVHATVCGAEGQPAPFGSESTAGSNPATRTTARGTSSESDRIGRVGDVAPNVDLVHTRLELPRPNLVRRGIVVTV